MLEELRQRWDAHVADFGADAATKDAAFNEIIKAHSEPHRAYHGVGHLQALFALLDRFAPQRSPALDFAVWWHDVIYSPIGADNEERSAGLAVNRLRSLGADQKLKDQVRDLILATKNHWNGPSTGEGDLFLDADIAILGARETVYDEYARGIRHEYSSAPDEMFRVGRLKFVGAAMVRTPMFRTAAFESAFGDSARQNLSREHALLSSQMPEKKRRPLLIAAGLGFAACCLELIAVQWIDLASSPIRLLYVALIFPALEESFRTWGVSRALRQGDSGADWRRWAMFGVAFATPEFLFKMDLTLGEMLRREDLGRMLFGVFAAVLAVSMHAMTTIVFASVKGAGKSFKTAFLSALAIHGVHNAIVFGGMWSALKLAHGPETDYKMLTLGMLLGMIILSAIWVALAMWVYRRTCGGKMAAKVA